MAENSWKNQSWICGRPSQSCRADAQIAHAVLLPCVLYLLLQAKTITEDAKGLCNLEFRDHVP